MKTRFTKNWTEISTLAESIKENMPGGVSLHEYLTNYLMRERMLSRTSAIDTLARLEKGVTLFYSQDESTSASKKIDVDSIIESISGAMMIDEKREFLLNMLFLEKLRTTEIPESVNMEDFFQTMKNQLSDKYGVTEDEVIRLKNDVLNHISGIIDEEMKLDQAVEFINSFKDNHIVIKEANVLANSKEDGLIYAAASFVYFSLQANVNEDSELTPEVIGTGAAFTLAAAEAIKNQRTGLISRETLHKVLSSLYKVFFCCLLAICAYLIFSGIAALSIYTVAICFSMGTFLGLISLIAAAYFITTSFEYIFTVGQQLWEWGEDGYDKICGFFSILFRKLKTLFCSQQIGPNETNHPSYDEPQITPDTEVILT